MFKNTGVNKCRKSAIHSEDGGLNDALKLARRLIKYTKKDTDNTLQGDEARELTVHNYGPGEWWLLLDSVGE